MSGPLIEVITTLTQSARFHEHASALNVSGTDLYNALLAAAELQPPNWDLQGRQANAWKALGASPYDDSLATLLMQV